MSTTAGLLYLGYVRASARVYIIGQYQATPLRIIKIALWNNFFTSFYIAQRKS